MLALLTLVVPVLLQGPHWSSKNLELEVDLPFLRGFEEQEFANGGGGDIGFQKQWSGKLGESDVTVELWTLDRKEYGLDTPEAVCSLEAYNMQRRGGDPLYRPEGHRLAKGKVGSPAFLCESWGLAFRGDPAKRCLKIEVGGLVPNAAWSLVVTATPPLSDKDRQALLEQLAGCASYDGKVEDPAWTEAEARARWEAGTDEAIHDQLRIKRTEHFIILTNSGGYKLCAKKLEEFYEKIAALYPFPEVEGRRLLPVFLFRQREEYLAFCQKTTGESRAQADTSAGHAFRDYYATTFESPNDPTHLHEITHQLFSNRMNLDGGGSWFQEGVAEYISETPNHVKAWAKQAAGKERFEAFPLFMKVDSLLGSAGTSQEGEDRYLQSAAIIRFVAESKKLSPRFHDFIYQVGSVQPNSLLAIEAVLQDLWGMKVQDFETAWVGYWKRGGRD